MFERMVNRVGLLVLSGLGLLLVGDQARADPQGWPVAGSWGFAGSSSTASFGGSSPSYYSTYQNATAPSEGYYGFAGNEGYYYGSVSNDYSYGALPTEPSGKRPVRINLRVPADAKIWFEGTQTGQTGTFRNFVSPPLEGGRDYAYQIRIQWKRDGNDVSQTRQITVHAGDVINLALGSRGSVLAW